MLLALPLVWIPADCGTPPPCEVTPDAIEAARLSTAAAAAESMADAPDEVAARAELEAAIAALKLEIKSGAEAGAERSALEQRLHELKQGSGR